MRGRADMVDRLLESLADEPRADVLFVATYRDEPVEEATRGLRRLIVPTWGRGDYAMKINHAYRNSSEPLLFLGAIDLRFHPGWLDACLAKLADGIGVVGTRDLCNPRTDTGDTSTHSLVTRDYADKFGTIDQSGRILHEGYAHEYVDDELVGTAKARGAYAHAYDAVVEHLHWTNGQRSRDGVDADHERRMLDGRRLFFRRSRLWTK
jgi:hypothetical protein